MERVMTVEEKIRRAEEIYERRRQGETRPVAKVTVNDKKDVKLLKKMVIQILVCVTIYLVFYLVKNHQYVFSEDFIHKSNEILSYDTNFIELYENLKNQVMNLTNQKQEQEPISQPENQPNQEDNQEGNQETNPDVMNEAIGGAEEIKEEPENQNVGEQVGELPQEEMDVQNIKNTTSFIKPVQGVISSKYGQRDTATGSVPKNHTGTDIAADFGTKIIAATEGEVVLSSEEGDYRKTFKNSNRRS